MGVVARTGQIESSKLVRTLEMIKSGFGREGKWGSEGSEDMSKVMQSQGGREGEPGHSGLRTPSPGLFLLH